MRRRSEGRGPLNVTFHENLLCVWKEVGLALRTLLATVDETLPVLPASTHREVNTHQDLTCVSPLWPFTSMQTRRQSDDDQPSPWLLAASPLLTLGPNPCSTRANGLCFSSETERERRSLNNRVRSEHRRVTLLLLPSFFQIEMAQKLLNSDLAELISKMKLAQQYVMTR